MDHAKERLTPEDDHSDDSFQYWWNSLNAAWQLHTLEPLTLCNQLQELSVTYLKEQDYLHLGALHKLKNLENYGPVHHLSFLTSMKQLEKLRLEAVLDKQYG